MGLRRVLLLIVFGYSLLLLQSALPNGFPPHPWTPMLVVPIVVALGIAPKVHPIEGAAIAFVLGYLLDLLSANPIGLHTFAMVSVFLLSRLIASRVSVRGRLFELVLTAIMTSLAVVVVVGLRQLFSADISVVSWRPTFEAAAASALATVVVAPFILIAAERISAGSQRRPDEVLR